MVHERQWKEPSIQHRNSWFFSYITAGASPPSVAIDERIIDLCCPPPAPALPSPPPLRVGLRESIRTQKYSAIFPLPQSHIIGKDRAFTLICNTTKKLRKILIPIIVDTRLIFGKRILFHIPLQNTLLSYRMFQPTMKTAIIYYGQF